MSAEPSASASLSAVALRWYTRVRWAAGLTELALALALLAEGRSQAPLLVLSTLPTLGTNAWLANRSSPPTERRLFGLTLVDILALAVFLSGAGGPSNPWSALFLVYVALASLLLSRRAVLVIVAASALAHRATFLFSDAHAGHGGAFDEHLEGMYVAYVVSSCLVAYFLTQTARALRERDVALAQSQERAARTSRVAALTTLAAGAAHELGSPLGTIAVAARELERALEAGGHPGELVDDARLVREEVGRCREILDRMAVEAGALVGEGPREARLAAVFGDLAARKGPRHARVRYRIEDASVRLPVAALQSIVENLVGNALLATPEGEVEVKATRRSESLVVEVTDHGVGMDAATLERAFQPFFTTRAPGDGTGLGLFLVEAMVTELGGSVELRSAPSEGTTARVTLPAEVGGA